jgi:hypothetical protein
MKTRIINLTAAAACSALVSACGGGGNSADTTPPLTTTGGTTSTASSYPRPTPVVGDWFTWVADETSSNGTINSNTTIETFASETTDSNGRKVRTYELTGALTPLGHKTETIAKDGKASTLSRVNALGQLLEQDSFSTSNVQTMHISYSLPASAVGASSIDKQCTWSGGHRLAPTFPLKSGSTETLSGIYVCTKTETEGSSSEPAMHYQNEIKVLDEETITAGGTSYLVIKVNLLDTMKPQVANNGASTGTVETNCWYSAQAKRYVRCETVREFTELAPTTYVTGVTGTLTSYVNK